MSAEGGRLAAESDDIRAKIERSSLGTADAVAARGSVSDETAARIVAHADLLGRIDVILRDHVVHAGAGAGKWYAECLSVDCGWSDHGDGALAVAIVEHRHHLAATLARVFSSPAPTTPTATDDGAHGEGL